MKIADKCNVSMDWLCGRDFNNIDLNYHEFEDDIINKISNLETDKKVKLYNIILSILNDFKE